MNMLIAIVFGGMALSGGPKAKAFAAFIGGCTMAFLDEFMYNVLMYAGIGSSSDYISMIVKAVLFLIVAFLLGMATRPKLLPKMCIRDRYSVEWRRILLYQSSTVYLQPTELLLNLCFL